MPAKKPKEEPKPLTIHQKISKISEEMGFLTFDKKNTGQGYEYASSAGAIRKLQLLLIKYGVVRYVVHRQFTFIPGENMKGNMVNTEAVWAWVCTETGDSIQTKSCGQGKDSSDKGMGKAQTNDNKYDIAHTLCLAWGAIDPDSDPYKETTKKKAPADPKKVAAAIKAAKTVEELEKSVKPEVLKLTGDVKKASVEAYKARKAELSA